MRFLQHSLSLLLSLFATKAVAVALSSLSNNDNDDSHKVLSYDEWLDMHPRKDYPTESEYVLREAIFKHNRQLVDRHNDAHRRGWTLYEMTMSGPFADLTDDEFRASYLMEWQHCSATTLGKGGGHTSSGSIQEYLQRINKRGLRDERSTSETQDGNGDNIIFRDDDDDDYAIDWRTKGILTPVKAQGSCGSCWTFSTTGTLEAHWCQSRRMDCTDWQGLAEQQLVDCASAYNNHGCNGGLPSQAFEYIQHSKHGLLEESQYPYHAKETGTCQVQNNNKSNNKKGAPSSAINGIHVTEVFNITSRDEDDLVRAIGHIGPVSIAYQVSPDFRFYSHGIYDSYNVTTNQTMCQSDSQSVNHAVVAVGLGRTDGPTTADSDGQRGGSGTPYYIVRNSWGKSWGMEGHFWMLRGENLCGVSDCASFPIVPTTTVVDKEISEDDDHNHDDESHGESIVTTMVRMIRG